LKLVEALLELGADIDSTKHSGRSALHEAARALSLPIIDVLLEAKARVRVRTRNGQTALHEVILGMFTHMGFGGLGCVERLIRAGVKVTAQDNGGITALHLAVVLGGVRLVAA
jgi:ankyrin repeat protein